MNKLNVFNQICIMNISCFGNIVGYEDEYISGLRNINPSEAILMDRMLNRKSSIISPTSGSLGNPYNTFVSSKRQYSLHNIESSVEIFDDKILALSKAKNSAVEAENYIEAEKLKQIVMKIEKLKIHIQKLENKKVEYANNENYEQAKRIKNEINRIRNIVLSINAGNKGAIPKMIPPLK
mmetsp:Transcript_14658/g.16920  ORF Transcript_14658/g.16920 Transcript_14658/m.16920 type:complete len:180 (-) Transcript_14658:29-568(-)